MVGIEIYFDFGMGIDSDFILLRRVCNYYSLLRAGKEK
jgi:hypothetical protein